MCFCSLILPFLCFWGGTCREVYLPRGGVPARGVYLSGRCTCLGGTCLGGCTCLGGVPVWGVYLSGGVPVWGVYLPGGVPAQGGVPVWGVYLSGGVPVRGVPAWGVPSLGGTCLGVPAWGVYHVTYPIMHLMLPVCCLHTNWVSAAVQLLI